MSLVKAMIQLDVYVLGWLAQEDEYLPSLQLEKALLDLARQNPVVSEDDPSCLRHWEEMKAVLPIGCCCQYLAIFEGIHFVS